MTEDDWNELVRLSEALGYERGWMLGFGTGLVWAAAFGLLALLVK